MLGPVLAAAVVMLIVVMGGCGSGSGNVAVTMSPGTPQALDQGQSVTLTAVVAHDSNHEGVSWALTSGPGALTNTSTTSATYSANGATGTAVVTATSIKNKARTATLNIAVTAMPSITMTSLPAGTEGTAYSQTVTETGGAGTLTFSVSAGSLPAGLTLSSSGAISGTPTGPNGTANFTVKVTDASTVAPQSATQALSITINLPAPPSITTTSLPAGVEGTAYNQTVAATGGLAPLTFTTSAGNLPPGLTMSSAGAITGTPTGPNGTSNFTVRVTDSSNPAQTATQALSITINLPAPPLISPTTLPGGNQGTPYSQTLTGSSGLAPYSWSVSAGALPAGLGLTTTSGTTATISGTPTTQQSNVAFTIQVTDSSNPSQHGTQAYTVTIGAPLPLSITTTSAQLPAGTENVAYTATNLTATGGVAPYTWSVVSPGTGALPTGMSLSSSGQLSGTPTVSGTFPFTAQVTDSLSETATASLSITIAAASASCGTGNEKVLKGQYAFNLIGYNSSGFQATIGSFTADGAGHITAGYVDANGVSPGVNSGTITASSSSYSVGPDNRGCATITTSFYTYTTRFALAPSSTVASGGYVQEWESGASPYIASGRLFLQSVPTEFPSGTFVLQFTGVSEKTGYSRVAAVGVGSGSGGQFTNGEYDLNSAGTSKTYTGAQGTYSAPDPTTGRVTVTGMLKSTNAAAYLVSSTYWIAITGDTLSSNNFAAVGSGQLQSSSFGLTTGQNLVFYATGLDEVEFALVNIASSSSLTANIYQDVSGTWNSKGSQASCSYTIDSFGKVAMSGTSCGLYLNGTTWSYPPVFYLTGANTGVMMGTDDPNVLLGQFAPQSATSITAGNYASGTLEVVSQSVDETATGTGSITSSGALTGTGDATSLSAPQQGDQALSLTLTVNSNGTYSNSNHPGLITGVVISSSQLVQVDGQGSTCPSLLMITGGTSE